VIKYIFSEEDDLTDETKKQLKEARQTQDSEYVKLN